MKEFIKKLLRDSQKTLLTSSFNRVKPAAPINKAASIEKSTDAEK